MIDYIWVSKDLNLRLINGNSASILSLDGTIDDYDETVSDHRPIMISLELNKK